MSNDRNWIWISFISALPTPDLCVCIRGFYFIAPNLLFKQEKRFEISMKLCFLELFSAAGRQIKTETNEMKQTRENEDGEDFNR